MRKHEQGHSPSHRRGGCQRVSRLVPLSRVNLNHVKLPVLPVPVENPLYARPATPLHALPARLSAAHPHLRHPRNVDIRAIDPRVPSTRTPRFIPLARRRR